MKNVVAMPNFIPAPMGPRKSTPEIRASLRKASVAAVRQRFAEHSRVSAKLWISVGKELVATKTAAKKDGPGVFAGMFARNAHERADQTRYPFSYSQARQLICVAQVFDREDVNMLTQRLPASWGTLYRLSRLPAERLAELIEAGTIHPMMSRGEASRLVGLIERPPRKRPSREDDPVDRAILALRQSIRQPKRRAAALLQLIRALGLTLQQLQEIDDE